MTRWRRVNRWLHRELGYIFFGMTIIYGISGIALNHHVAGHWNPSLVMKTDTLQSGIDGTSEHIKQTQVKQFLETIAEQKNLKHYYFPDSLSLYVYLDNGHITVDLESGEAILTKVRKRPFFQEINFLHYNKPKKVWMYFSDLYALSMILLAISGLFLVRGRKGVTGRGAWVVMIGILIPVVFIAWHLWF